MTDPIPADISPAPKSTEKHNPIFQPPLQPYSPQPSEAGSSISNLSTAITELETKILTDLPKKLEAAVSGEASLRAERLQARVSQLEEQLSQKSMESAAASSAHDHLEKECEKWERQCQQMMQMLMNGRQVCNCHVPPMCARDSMCV